MPVSVEGLHTEPTRPPMSWPRAPPMDHEQAGEAAVGKGLVLTLVPTTHTYKTGVKALPCRHQVADTESTALLSVQWSAGPWIFRPPCAHSTDEAN